MKLSGPGPEGWTWWVCSQRLDEGSFLLRVQGSGFRVQGLGFRVQGSCLDSLATTEIEVRV